jgi:hypothetical protein
VEGGWLSWLFGSYLQSAALPLEKDNLAGSYIYLQYRVCCDSLLDNFSTILNNTILPIEAVLMIELTILPKPCVFETSQWALG